MPTQQSDLHTLSLSNPEAFWSEAAKAVSWYRPPEKIFVTAEDGYHEKELGPAGYRWFAGSELNTCYNALDRHIDSGNGSRTALIYESPVTNAKCKYSYAELLDEVEVFAGVLKELGVVKGGVVLIYMPMIPEAVIGMLACARLGAVHSVVFGGFAAKELAKRIDDCKPHVILTASCGIEPSRVIQYQPLLHDAVNLSTHKPPTTILFQRPQHPAQLTTELDWISLVSSAKQKGVRAGCALVKGEDPCYIIYTSGSTGVPKGVVRDSAGHAVALNWSMSNIFGVNPGDTFFAASDIGWVVGHSYIVYGPLMHGCTTLLYEGKPTGTPHAGAFWRLVEEYQVKVLFTSPTAIRAIKREDPLGTHSKNHNITSLHSVFLAGERSDPDTVNHFTNLLNIPIRDNYWQSETGWPITAPCSFPPPNNHLNTSPKTGSAGLPIPGYNVVVLGPTAHPPLPPNTFGNLAIKLPLPPGCFLTLLNNATGFKKTYLTKFPGYFDLTDAGFVDEEGYVFIMSRTDDVINVAGHRISTGAIEEVLGAVKEVAECAVVGVKDDIKGQVPVAFITLKHDTHSTPSLLKTLYAVPRTHISPIATLKNVYILPKLPKTRSGKILRRTLRNIVEGVAYEIPATIEDEGVLKDVENVVAKEGKARL